MRRFQRLLTDHAQETFDDIELSTTWGLLVITFSGPRGTVNRAVNLDLLCLTNELVVNDHGKLVDRYAALVDQLYLDAEKKLAGPSPLRLN